MGKRCFYIYASIFNKKIKSRILYQYKKYLRLYIIVFVIFIDLFNLSISTKIIEPDFNKHIYYEYPCHHNEPDNPNLY